MFQFQYQSFAFRCFIVLFHYCLRKNVLSNAHVWSHFLFYQLIVAYGVCVMVSECRLVRGWSILSAYFSVRQWGSAGLFGAGYIFFSCFNVRRWALLGCWGRAVCRWVMCRVAGVLGPFRAVGRLMDRFQSREVNAGPPRLPRFIMLKCFSDTLLMVLILGIIVICSRFCSPEGVKDLTKAKYEFTDRNK